VRGLVSRIVLLLLGVDLSRLFVLAQGKAHAAIQCFFKVASPVINIARRAVALEAARQAYPGY
jgi:hypothetical protein